MSAGDINPLFVGRDPLLRELLERLRSALGSLGPVALEAKRAAIRLSVGPTGNEFAVVQLRKSALLLRFTSMEIVADSRARSVRQISAYRFEHEVLLSSPDDVNGELLRSLTAAYQLARSGE